jgi:hypothetical protein
MVAGNNQHRTRQATRLATSARVTSPVSGSMTSPDSTMEPRTEPPSPPLLQAEASPNYRAVVTPKARSEEYAARS